MKICKICKLELEYNQFLIDKRNKHGIQGICKKCNNIRLRQYEKTAIKNGLCLRCYKLNDSVNNKRYCNACIDKYKQRKLKILSKGLCGSCGKLPRINKTVCINCYFKAVKINGKRDKNNAVFLKNLLIQQNYTCPYSGQKLYPGNMSLDHILPVSKYPMLANDFNNLQWVTIEVNTAKNNMTEDEFKEFIDTCYNHIHTKK